MRTLKGAAAAFAILVALGVTSRSERPAHLHRGLAPLIPDAAAAIPEDPSPELPSGELDYLSILNSLPSDREGLRGWVEDWCRLEAALIGRESNVLEALLRRYEGEVDPAYKGLLAVLLSTDTRTHRRLLDDHLAHPNERWDLFHGMTLLALARSHPENAAAALASDRVEWWNQLFRFVDVGVISHELAVEYRTTGVYRKLACSTSSRHMFDGCKLAEECPPATKSGLRAALLAAYSKKWDWYFVQQLSRLVMQTSAATDPLLARTLAETYLGSASEESAEQGLSLLRDAVLPDDVFPLLENWARTAVDGWVIRRAIEVLGNQKNGAAERVLLEFHAARPKYLEEILEAMTKHGAASFQPIAEAELRSKEADIRIAALRLLSKMPTPEAWNLLLQAGVTDSHDRARYEVLVIMKERNTWSRQEDQILKILITDPVDRIRILATTLCEARDKSTVSAQRYSSWSWKDPGEEE